MRIRLRTNNGKSRSKYKCKATALVTFAPQCWRGGESAPAFPNHFHFASSEQSEASTRGTLVSGCTRRLVPMFEHLPERSSPFSHAGVDKPFEFCLRWSPTAPGTGLRGQGAGMFRDETSRFGISIMTRVCGLQKSKIVLTLSPFSPRPANSSSSSGCCLGPVPPMPWLRRGIPN